MIYTVLGVGGKSASYISRAPRLLSVLDKNYDVEEEVWLIYYKKHTKKARIIYDDAVEEALCFGWIDSILRKLDEDRYAQKFSPRKGRNKWSPKNIERAEKMIQEGGNPATADPANSGTI